MYIRKDDIVVVITGDDKGPEPRKVLRVLTEKNKIIVEGVNRVWKHMKPSQKNQQGGRLSKEMPISVSNVMLYSPTARRGVRVGFRYTESGQKERYCKVSGASLGTVGPVKPAYATSKKPVAASKKP
ncbi:MAG: ribosomal protein bacterial/organelle [Planctomycetota bacterium]|nr:ribosomal protein bacterial/organelle [Planctomycetota bacterium]